MYLVAGIIGLAIGVVIWFTASYAIAHSITWIESRYPQLAGSKGVRVGEVVACGALFAACIMLAFWVAHLLVQDK